MFMEKMSSLLYLVPVQGTAIFDVLNGLLLLAVKLILTSWLVSMHGRIEFLEAAEIGARRRSYQKI